MTDDLESLADWSDWYPFKRASVEAPLLPGVYLARLGDAGPVVYVGMAGERRGKGVRGRLSIYSSGKAAVSGLGEASFNRALLDLEWVRARLAGLESGEKLTAQQWARAAIEHWDLHVRWATTTDRAGALELEREVIRALEGLPLWNVRR